MAHKLLKSMFPTEEHINSFQRLLNNHMEERRKHAAHMKMVEEDPENYHSYPHPDIGAHPDIIGSIVDYEDDYNIEFELEDDVTPPIVVETLQQKKDNLLIQVHDRVTEQERKLGSHPLKARAAQYAIADIMNIPMDKRTKKQVATLEAHQEKEKRKEKLYRKLAEVESAIHDLDDETVDNWVIPSFEVK